MERIFEKDVWKRKDSRHPAVDLNLCCQHMYLLNNIIFKIISTLVIFLISIIYPTSSKTNDGSFELSMDCTDKNKIFKSYIKKRQKFAS